MKYRFNSHNLFYSGVLCVIDSTLSFTPTRHVNIYEFMLKCRCFTLCDPKISQVAAWFSSGTIVNAEHVQTKYRISYLAPTGVNWLSQIAFLQSRFFLSLSMDVPRTFFNFNKRNTDEWFFAESSFISSYLTRRWKFLEMICHLFENVSR